MEGSNAPVRRHGGGAGLETTTALAVLLALVLAVAGAGARAQPDTAPATVEDEAAAETVIVDPAVPGKGVLVDSASVRDVFDPLSGVATPGATWRAAVATLPDPVESRMGRSFDIEVATLVRSFQFGGYVLQGHAMPCRGRCRARRQARTPGAHTAPPPGCWCSAAMPGARRATSARTRSTSCSTWSANRRPSACRRWRSAAQCARRWRWRPAATVPAATTVGATAWRRGRQRRSRQPPASPCSAPASPVRCRRSPRPPAKPACTWT